MSKFAVVDTTMGQFTVELYADRLPITCCKFVQVLRNALQLR